MSEYSLGALMESPKNNISYPGGYKQARIVQEMLQESATLMHHDTITGTSP